MKRISILMACLVFAGAGLALAETPVGSVETATGTVEALGAEGLSRTLGPGSPVFLSDTITTGPGAGVQIRFADNSVIGQGEQSQMVVQDYLYAPKDKDENRAVFQMLKGMFRVVTDKITQLNPERFSVKTNYGTIGIRGCELAFEVNDDVERVGIVALHTADSVVVSMEDGPGVRSVVVEEDGVQVELSPDTGIKQSALSEDFLEDLVLTPAPATPPTLSRDDGLTPPDIYTQAATKSLETTDPAATVSTLDVQDRVDTVASAPTGVATGKELAEEEAKERALAIAVNPVPTADRAGDGGGGGSIDYPIQGARQITISGVGTDWSWDVWEQEVTDLVDGSPERSITHGANIDGQFITPADFDTVAAAPVLRALTGIGSAGASVVQGNKGLILQGQLNLNVRVGFGAPSIWDGTVSLANISGDTLDFTADGSITQGHLNMAALSAYNLDVFGRTYGTPGSANVEGRLVGPGSGLTPITGGVLQFDFNHGAGNPKVAGAGGATF